MTYLLNCIRQKRLVKYGSVCHAYYIDRCLLPAGNELASKNSALSATVLYSGGGRPLNYTEPWNETLNFSSFQKIEMTLRFQAQDILIPLSTYGGDESIKSFGFNTYNDNDGQQRVISGYLQFAGRYITNAHAQMRLADQVTQVDTSNITVTRIVGYKNA